MVNPKYNRSSSSKSLNNWIGERTERTVEVERTLKQTTVEPLELEDVRAEYSGTFVKVESWYSSYTGAHEQYIVFEDIQGPNLALLRDQQIFTYGKRFRAVGLLEPGDRVRFHARIVFGMWGFKLSRPTKIFKV